MEEQVMWRKAKFVCLDCGTEIDIKTTLPFTHKPWRMACPCKYSALHRYTEWEVIPWEEIENEKRNKDTI